MATIDSPLHTPNLSPVKLASKSISDLRALAQSHLRELEQETIASQSDRIARNLQLQLYAKQPRRPQSTPQHQLRHQGIKSTSHARAARQAEVLSADHPSQPPPEAKLPVLRPVSNVLHRIEHDPSLKLSERCKYIIGYLERFDGIVEMPVTAWIKESTEEDFVPQHRIRYITRRRPGDDEVVWSRDERIDKIFGSGKEKDGGV